MKATPACLKLTLISLWLPNESNSTKWIWTVIYIWLLLNFFMYRIRLIFL